MFSVSKGSSLIYTSEQIDALRVSTEIEAIRTFLEIDVDAQLVILTFQNVTCELDGEYTVQLNNASSFKSTFRLNVDSK